ncbi:type II restriction endonuclease [Helicobacter pylori]|uniref:restriction endonuclease subunit S n=1 Tax=Helicobacter pylori TaxID=210 RepID=UPI000EAF9C5F|nr:restriction endonuclease subunit S [Helicobacter pylori]RKV34193.1 type II restriction endonuclease [Helicobacter pylori]
MIGPLNSQLNAIKWGEFKLGDLFEKIIIKPLPYQTAQLPKEKTPTHELPALTAGILNQGLNNFVPKENATILKNVISISANGANTGATFYQPHEFCVLQDAYAIEFIGDKKLNDKEYLFFVCAISKAIYNNSKYEWTNKASWNKVKNELISLPLKPTAKTQTLENIDFTFMEKFIAELEQCRLAELQAYLKATGLENTTLSSDEENALNVFNNSRGGGNTPCGLTWQSFRLGDLFEIRPTKAYNLTNSHLFDSNAKNPVVTNSSLNNGISGYSSLEPTEKGNQITYSDTTTSEGIFYQKRPFIGYSHVQGLYPLKYHEFWNEKTLLYIVVAFKKVACGRFNYGNKFNRKIASEMSILLPTKQHGKIDFHFMHTFINALMKQTIQGVAEYCSAKIQATKEIISQETPVQKDSLF